jgi:NAD+-dependent protein deacetylase SIR2
VLPSLDLKGVAEHIKHGRARKIVVLCGAGISTSAGIPGDVRFPAACVVAFREQ